MESVANPPSTLACVSFNLKQKKMKSVVCPSGTKGCHAIWITYGDEHGRKNTKVTSQRCMAMGESRDKCSIHNCVSYFSYFTPTHANRTSHACCCTGQDNCNAIQFLNSSGERSFGQPNPSTTTLDVPVTEAMPYQNSVKVILPCLIAGFVISLVVYKILQRFKIGDVYKTAFYKLGFVQKRSREGHLNVTTEDEIININLNEETIKLHRQGKLVRLYNEFEHQNEFCAKDYFTSLHKEAKKSFKNEVTILSFLKPHNHPNIVEYIDHRESQACSRIVLKYYKRGSLYSYLLKNELTLSQCCEMITDVSAAVSYLHGGEAGCEIVHRDIKSSNFLVSENGRLKICDFETSQFVTYPSTSPDCRNVSLFAVGTYTYMSPELLSSNIDYNHAFTELKSADTYALALVMWEITSRCKGFYDGIVPEYKAPYTQEVEDSGSSLYDVVVVLGKRPKLNFLQTWLEKLLQGVPEEMDNTLCNDAIYRNANLISETCSLIRAITEAWSKEPEARATSSLLNEKSARFRNACEILFH